jgi:GMP synthase (glutamine-hydrolysing)
MYGLLTRRSYQIPPKFEILASSPICDIEAIKHPEKPLMVYNFQLRFIITPEGPKVFENFYEFAKNRA